ncbi:MAG: hypothetical protein AAF699_17235 [Pseudomonadota bacterium]
MKRQVQIACYLISGLLLFGGIADLVLQYQTGQELQWRVPLILFGTGLGLPLVIFPLFGPLEKPEPDDYDEENVAGIYQSGQGNLMGSKNYAEESSLGSNDSDYGGGSGDGGGDGGGD